MFEPLNTSDHTTAYRKTLLYGHHGWGKTPQSQTCLLYTSPSPRDRQKSRMPSSA